MGKRFRAQGDEPLVGSDGDDLILGNDDDNIIFGGGGSDIIFGGGGDDIIYGDMTSGGEKEVGGTFNSAKKMEAEWSSSLNISAFNIDGSNGVIYYDPNWGLGVVNSDDPAIDPATNGNG